MVKENMVYGEKVIMSILDLCSIQRENQFVQNQKSVDIACSPGYYVTCATGFQPDQRRGRRLWLDSDWDVPHKTKDMK